MSMDNIIIIGLAISAISFFSVFFVMPYLIKYLVAKGNVVPDAHKPGRPNIPRPAGPLLFAAIAVSESLLYVFTREPAVAALIAVSVISFIVGYIDDKKTMRGWFKPVALVAAAIPLIMLNVHGSYLNLVFGSAYIPILYIPLILILIPVAGNTINSIDVLNGVASGFVLIAMIPLMISIAIFGSISVFLMALPVFFATCAFYIYHRFPTKIFPGDSGTLLLGTLYGALAIAGRSEIIGVIALLPAVMNSFLFLASVKRIVEHREVKSRLTILTNDFRLMASKEKSAPSTLLRLILTDGPLTEKEIGTQIFKLAVFSSILSFITIMLQYIFVVGVS